MARRWGSAPGVVAHNGKAAATGAAAGGIASFLASSGIGQELDLQKGTKLDLVLDRPLYLNRSEKCDRDLKPSNTGRPILAVCSEWVGFLDTPPRRFRC